MLDRCAPQSLVILTTLIGLTSFAPGPVHADHQAAAVSTATAQSLPRTPWGDPDLQGTWNFANLTPLERPSGLAGKQTLTAEEAAEFEKQALKERNATLSTGDREWWDPGSKVMKARRTSLVIDPPDGRVPPLTDDAQRRNAARRCPAVPRVR